jgi:molybdenum cofactor synthesis domain-containing protein
MQSEDDMTGEILAVCTSDRRGIQKTNVSRAVFVENYGIEGDAHGGSWHRQVSLISADKIDEFRSRGANVAYGAFGENLVVEGIDFRTLPVGTLLRCGDVLLEMTQIGKECHAHCAIFHQVGDCIMPREGVFARVLEGGTIQVGDRMVAEHRTGKLPWQAAVITLSDKGAKGEREDQSGPAIADRLRDSGYDVIEQFMISDDPDLLKHHLIRLCDQRRPDLILTTGGTGFSMRDRTPEATLAVAERNVPGIAEAIRAASLKITKHAMLSRAVSVIRGKTLIINLPGCPKACMESMDDFMDAIPHAMGLLRGDVQDCAR